MYVCSLNTNFSVSRFSLILIWLNSDKFIDLNFRHLYLIYYIISLQFALYLFSYFNV